MTGKDYRTAIDAVKFASDFQDRTMARLEAQKKECTSMKKPIRIGLIAASLAAALAVTASAALLWLTPKDVAERVQNPALAAAFESEDAVTINQTQTVGGYDVTLLGLVSSEGLDAVDADQEQTYAVLAYTRTDGGDITEDWPLTVSPVISGCAPWQVNAWTLGGGVTSFAENGVFYYLFGCDTLEPFADHTVSLAVYPGTHVSPSSDQFLMEDDGTIAFRDGQEGVLFRLPLDESKADPAKAAEFLASVS